MEYPNRSLSYPVEGLYRPMPTRVRVVENLAAKLYGQENPKGKAWIMLGWNIREPWITQAKQQIESAGLTSRGGRFRSLLKSIFKNQVS